MSWKISQEANTGSILESILMLLRKALLTLLIVLLMVLLSACGGDGINRSFERIIRS